MRYVHRCMKSGVEWDFEHIRRGPLLKRSRFEVGEKIFARQLGNVNTWTILKEMMKMIMMRMGCIIMTESEQEFSCLLNLYAL